MVSEADNLGKGVDRIWGRTCTSVQHVAPEERKGHHHHCSGLELGDTSETFASFFSLTL